MKPPLPLRRLTIFFVSGSSLLLCGPAARSADAPVPAPVPAEVAIARPSPAEVAQAAESLQKFAAQADSATKAILAKYPDLIAIRPPRINPAVVPSLNPGHRAKHAANVEIAQKGDIDVLFMGDSITDWWRSAGAPGAINPRNAGKAVFDKYFGAMKVANFGIAGDTTQGVLFRLRDGEGQGFQPKAIMLMIGTNNAGNCSSAEIAEGIGAIVLEMRRDFPEAKILLLGIFPRANPGDQIRKTALDVNPLIAKLHDGKNVFYLDIGARFLDAEGMLPADIMPDKLHPTEKGYEIWAEAVKEPLAELMK
ncbi:MAG TPA: GDSL-type esterase/lipase family protein [Opitutaceae bacterium]|nr:GDSL-type esterase/lipase family protein [Opitutaceae bacterium]